MNPEGHKSPVEGISFKPLFKLTSWNQRSGNQTDSPLNTLTNKGNVRRLTALFDNEETEKIETLAKRMEEKRRHSIDVQPPRTPPTPQIHQFAVGSFRQRGDHIYLQRFRAPRLPNAFRLGLTNRK
jgi:hypothetical protein